MVVAIVFVVVVVVVVAVGNREVALSGQAAFGKMHSVVLGQERLILRVNPALIFLILSTLHLF